MNSLTNVHLQVDSFDLSSFLPQKGKKTAPILERRNDDEPSITRGSKHFESIGTDSVENSTVGDVDTPSPTVESSVEDIKLPIANAVSFKQHSRAVCSISMDPAGSRMITGGYDYAVKFWDFNGMDRGFQSFRSINPWDGYQIRQLRFSNRGDVFLVASGALGAKLYDRDGFELSEYNKGDPYIRDMKNTNGHVSGLTCIAWHPTQRNLFLTGGLDNTVRIWEVEAVRKQRHVMVARGPNTNRQSASISAADFTLDGNMVVAARIDGGISLWDWKHPYLKPKQHVDRAHMPGTETTGLALGRDGYTIVSRGGDDTMKIWDLRKFTEPLKVFRDLPNMFAQTNVVFSPIEDVIVTGVSARSKDGPGQVHYYNSKTFGIVHSEEVPAGSAVCVHWNPRINQVVVGVSDGSMQINYDTTISEKGIIPALSRAPKRKTEMAFTSSDGVYLPHALPMFREGDDGSSDRNRKKKDKILSHRPEPQTLRMFGPGKHGQVGMSENSTIMKLIDKKTTRDENPREALLKYAQEAEGPFTVNSILGTTILRFVENPTFINHVYKKNQPKPVFDTDIEDLKQQPEVKRRN